MNTSFDRNNFDLDKAGYHHYRFGDAAITIAIYPDNLRGAKDRTFVFGFTYCSPQDTFLKKKGRMIASGYAKQKFAHPSGNFQFSGIETITLDKSKSFYRQMIELVLNRALYGDQAPGYVKRWSRTITDPLTAPTEFNVRRVSKAMKVLSNEDSTASDKAQSVETLKQLINPKTGKIRNDKLPRKEVLERDIFGNYPRFL